MVSDEVPPVVPSNKDNIALWSAIPPARLAAMDPEGDFGKRHVLNRALFDLIGDPAGLRILDAGAGQGYLSRLLARRGGVVTSLEPADALIAHSRRLQEQEPLDVEYVQGDLTELTIAPEFDLVVASMVFLAIRDWTRALAACAAALRPGGVLVFSVNHPCFETGAWHPSADDPHVAVRDYLTERPLARPVATDFHRTLATYLNAVVAAGLVITGVAEPGLDPALVADPSAPDTAALLTTVPDFLVVRAQRPA